MTLECASCLLRTSFYARSTMPRSSMSPPAHGGAFAVTQTGTTVQEQRWTGLELKVGRRSGGAGNAGRSFNSRKRSPKTSPPSPNRSECTGGAHHWLLDPPETSEVSGRCLKCNRERIWPTTIYGKYENTPAVMHDPLIPRNYIGSRGIENYD